MIQVGAYPGVVIAGPTAPGPASGMAYTMVVNTATGARTVEGIVPVMERWPDEIDVMPIKPGTFVMVGTVNGRWQLGARELPAFRVRGGGGGGEPGPSGTDDRVALLELRLAELERRLK